VGTMLREFYDAQGVASAGIAHGLWRGHGYSIAGPSRNQICGSEGRNQGGCAPSCNSRGRRQIPVPVAEPRA
jgi:hypothetical protein